MNDTDHGIEGEVVIFRNAEKRAAERTLAGDRPVRVVENSEHLRMMGRGGMLLRGGFLIGSVPGLPLYSDEFDARIEVIKDQNSPRYPPITNIARSGIIEASDIEDTVLRAWLENLLKLLPDVENRPVGSPHLDERLLSRVKWIENYDAYDIYRLAKSCRCSLYSDPKAAKAAAEEWEQGHGPLHAAGGSSTMLHWWLYSLVLPKICSLILDDDGRLKFGSPKSGWQKDLIVDRR